MANGFDKSGSVAGALQSARDGGFGEARIFQRGLPDARLFVVEQGGRDRDGAAAGQRNSFTETDRGEARDQEFVGSALQVGGGGGQLGKVHQVEGVEFAEQTEREAARGARMGGKRKPDFARFQQRGDLGKMLDTLGEEIGALQES